LEVHVISMYIEGMYSIYTSKNYVGKRRVIV